MEQAIRIDRLSYLRRAGAKYKRIYFGAEFCERLIPSVTDVEKAFIYAGRNKRLVSLVTPYVTNEGVRKLRAIFDWLRARDIACEIIINDWGVFHLVTRMYPRLNPVIGRLLTKQKRGPDIAEMLKRKRIPPIVKVTRNPQRTYMLVQKTLPPGVDDYYRGSNMGSVPVIHDFLVSQGVRRVEFDNTRQGLMLDLPAENLSASVYYPYVYISTTFFCPTAGCDDVKRSVLKIRPCTRQCSRYHFILRHRQFPTALFLKGNTFFYKNCALTPDSFASIGVDRVIHEPYLVK